jgi:hypothetical protein
MEGEERALEAVNRISGIQRGQEVKGKREGKGVLHVNIREGVKWAPS